jgi:Domain of unknown function (DUF4845)
MQAVSTKSGRHPSRSQRGEGRAKAIAFTAFLVFGIFAAVRLLPPYMAEYQLADKMQELARFAVVNRYSEEQIRDHVLKEVKDLEIPVNREDIKVNASNEKVTISVDYRIPVDLLIYHFDLHFNPTSQDKNLI